ncbi:DUF3325 domain-containing protein [Comamonas sp. Tr-654]|uniref:DUF3325 domain-containing protein n=1 Tax=Comamonas sp. Tr-654 TaxID=2608341 RepID=UPI00141E032A|nr:DUF3325 domain-containing protein [Comamonas sp. Tr-654]NIF85806.1 DUF3325 domain-containing protein [Comamonas sp. Tr-654]
MSMLHTTFLALALAWAGMTALALAMERHYEQLTGALELPQLHRRLLRGAAVLLLPTSLLLCLASWGCSVGVTSWIGLLSVGASGTATLLCIQPRWAGWMAISLILGAGMVCLIFEMG